ncbi:unnamed protein product [Cladocopium goreaui]|uniref:BI1-like protein n=1 Tax=Cladocopium goreaui TaxID=2562237 RepID=A0A9P1GM45_9DINO|nr:unnamed protein product [Cladocopium goreaui]
MMDLEGQRFAELQGIGEKRVRAGFIQKVYGIVCTQVLATAAVAALCCGPLQPAVMALAMNHPSAYRWGSLIALLVAIGLCHAGKKSYPLNFFGLCFLTAVMALNVGVICGMVAAAGLGALVVQAALITGSLVLGLTIYTFRSKRDFSFLGAVLYPKLARLFGFGRAADQMTFGLLIFGLLSIFFPALRTGWLHLGMSFLGAGIFCAYLVFDTWRIATVLKVDDYVEGAIQCLSCDQGPGMGFP